VVRLFPTVTGRLLLATPLRRLLLWLQLRTRAIDDIVTGFMTESGAQLVLLGAGFDSRAARMASLSGRPVFEVDHPATQARKRAVMQAHSLETAARFVAWDFERDCVDELPSALQACGLDPGRPTVTVWEGVIPYLSEAAVAATLAAVRCFGSGDSRVVLHYVERSHVGRLRSHRIAARLGETMRFGWEPSELPEWLRARGFALMNDRSDGDLARQFFPERWSRRFRASGGRIAMARPL
jgi:methyltransferase (TIGR00027 family)